MFRLFFLGTTGSLQRRKTHASTAAGIRQLIGGLLYVAYFLMKKNLYPKETMENDYYFKHFKFCLEQWFKYLGRKIHQ
jgi:hypothetical protein